LKFAISNIAWPSDWDCEIFEQLKNLGYQGIEIAPLRTFPTGYQSSLEEIEAFHNKLVQYGLKVLSMQSILSNFEGSLFESEASVGEGQKILHEAFEFCHRMGIPNVVFGSPRNRNMTHTGSKKLAEQFFKAIVLDARAYNINVALEANPTIYNTNFLNHTDEAIAYVQEFKCDNFGINLDLGTMIYNQEKLDSLLNTDTLHKILHVHISEPYLKAIDREKRTFHASILKRLIELDYQKAISIELSPGLSLSEIIGILEYVKTLRDDSYAEQV